MIKSRANEARKIIFPLIDEWSMEINNNLQAQFSQMVSELFVKLIIFMKKQQLILIIMKKT